MNREIKFRGLVADEPNTWVYGYLIANNMIAQVEEREDSKCCGVGTFIVIPETVKIQLAMKYMKGICLNIKMEIVKLVELMKYSIMKSMVHLKWQLIEIEKTLRC